MRRICALVVCLLALLVTTRSEAGGFELRLGGYFPRAGVIDRRYNPRAGMQLIQQISSLLSGRAEFDEPLLETWDHLISFTLGTAGKVCIICIPDDDFGLSELEAYLGRLAGQVSDWRLLDLVSNETLSLESKSDLNRTLAKHYPFALLG